MRAVTARPHRAVVCAPTHNTIIIIIITVKSLLLRLFINIIIVIKMRNASPSTENVEKVVQATLLAHTTSTHYMQH